MMQKYHQELLVKRLLRTNILFEVIIFISILNVDRKLGYKLHVSTCKFEMKILLLWQTVGLVVDKP